MSRLDIKFTRLTPFKRCVLQNFPFIEADFDALTNYGLLCKVVEYLNKVIDSQNEVQGVTEEIVTAFNNLYDYVKNFFDNLDVQDEINNKLDAMVEDGTLQEIITTYIQSNVTWTFDNVSSMKSATNLMDGSYAKTLGYYQPNDGGASQYLIRSRTESDTPNDGNLIAIGDDLIAELIVINDQVCVKQFGAKGDGTTDDSTAINNALSFKGNDKIAVTFVGSETYLSTGIKYIYSNTTIDLNSSIILGSADCVWQCDKDSVCSAGYTGINNIVIKNGTFKNETHFRFFHSTNIKVENILFDDAHQAWHVFDLGGVKGFSIKNCEFYGNGNTDWSTQMPSIEAIQTDFASRGGQPDWETIQPSVVYDNVPTIDVLIENCYFHKKSGDTQCSTAIGTHSNDIAAGQVLPIQNITIRGCKFEGWYRNAIHFMKVKNLLIENSDFIPLAQLYSGDPSATAAIQIASNSGNYGLWNTENIVIRNNSMISSDNNYDRSFIWLEEYTESYLTKNVVIEGNTYKCDTSIFLFIRNASDIQIDNNNVRSCHNFIQCAQDSLTSNLNIYDNFVNLKGSNPEFLRSTTEAVAPYWDVNGLNDHNNIVTKVIDDTLTTINKSAFICKCTLDSDKSYTSADDVTVEFDSCSNSLCSITSGEVKPIRLLRNIKIGGYITVKATSGGKVQALRAKVWDMVKNEFVYDEYVRYGALDYSGSWTTLELPTLWLKDDSLKVRPNVGPRYSYILTITTNTGDIEIRAADTVVNFYNW